MKKPITPWMLNDHARSHRSRSRGGEESTAHQRLASRSLLTYVKITVTLRLQQQGSWIGYKQKGCHHVLHGEVKMSYTVREGEKSPT